MALPWKVTTLETVDEPHRGLYVEQEDKTFKLDVSGLEIPDVVQLKKALGTEREQARASKKALDEAAAKLETVKDIDPEKYKSLLERETELKSKDTKDRKDFETAKAAIEQKHETEKQELLTRLSAVENARLDDFKRTEVIQAINKADGHVQVLLNNVLPRVKIVQDQDNSGAMSAQVLDDANQPLYSDDPEKPHELMTVLEFVNSLKKDTAFVGCFRGLAGSGSGSGPALGGGTGGDEHITKKSQLPTPQAKAEYIKNHGGDKYLSLAP